jgi:hypothetical protein
LLGVEIKYSSEFSSLDDYIDKDIRLCDYVLTNASGQTAKGLLAIKGNHFVEVQSFWFGTVFTDTIIDEYDKIQRYINIYHYGSQTYKGWVRCDNF